jgi:hypothetical protein
VAYGSILACAFILAAWTGATKTSLWQAWTKQDWQLWSATEERENMAKQINWSYSVEVVAGSSTNESDTISVEAVDEIEVSVDAEEEDFEVDVQPEGVGRVAFLLIKAKPYDEDITYKINDSAAEVIRTLDGPHVFIGKGAAATLDPEPSKLFITNGLQDDPVSVSILVGRNATP